MKVTLMYETQVEVVVDTLTLSVDSISVIHQLGSSLGGIGGGTANCVETALGMGIGVWQWEGDREKGEFREIARCV